MSALYWGRWVGLNSPLPASLKMIAISSTRRSTPMRNSFDCAAPCAAGRTSKSVSAAARNDITPREGLVLILPVSPQSGYDDAQNASKSDCLAAPHSGGLQRAPGAPRRGTRRHSHREQRATDADADARVRRGGARAARHGR